MRKFLLEELPFNRFFDTKLKNINLSLFNLRKYLNYYRSFLGYELLELRQSKNQFTLLYSKESFIASSFSNGENIYLNEEALKHLNGFDKSSIVNIYSIYSNEIVSSLLSLFYGELIFKNISFKNLDIYEPFSLLSDINFTGIICFVCEDKKEYLFSYDGKTIIIEDGYVKNSFPLRDFPNNIPDSFIPILSNPKTIINIFSYEKDTSPKPLPLLFSEEISDEIYITLSEYVKRIAGGKGLYVFEKYFSPNDSKTKFLSNIPDFEKELTRLVGKPLTSAIIKFIREKVETS
ncbi:MAG: hypothetical protein CBR30_08980 [Dictyoglomus sp. NZ13-RE01]|nr:MAG: hypothetical protein CBR30_08980 [Dictyoglomus sp. NZ13-RE01]